jgi:hypothetical protein
VGPRLFSWLLSNYKFPSGVFTATHTHTHTHTHTLTHSKWFVCLLDFLGTFVLSILPGSNYRLKIIFEKKRRHMSCLCLRVLLLVLLLLLLGADDTIIMMSKCFGGRFGGGVSVVGAFRLVPSSAIKPLAYRKRIVSSGIANNMNIINHRHQFLKQSGIFVGQTKLFATTTSPSKFSESYGNLTKAEQDAVRLQTNIRTDIRNWASKQVTWCYCSHDIVVGTEASDLR